MVNQVRNLNDIRRQGNLGLYKRWILNSKTDYHKLCDYMQKINFSIQDLNSEIEYLQEPRMKNIIYVIILVVWIKEASEKFFKLYKKEVINNFFYASDSKMEKVKRFIDALRSFVVAHPLSTSRHKDFGFDGSFICVDIRTSKKDITFAFVKDDEIYHLDYDGLHRKKQPSDFYLYVYSDKDDGMKYFRYIGCKISDIYRVADLYIDKLYALDTFLSKQKQSLYGEINE